MLFSSSYYFNAWTSQMFMKFSHSIKSNIQTQLLSNLAKQLINYKLWRWHEAHLWVIIIHLISRGWCRASSGPLIRAGKLQTVSTVCDTFAYRSPCKKLVSTLCVSKSLKKQRSFWKSKWWEFVVKHSKEIEKSYKKVFNYRWRIHKCVSVCQTLCRQIYLLSVILIVYILFVS